MRTLPLGIFTLVGRAEQALGQATHVTQHRDVEHSIAQHAQEMQVSISGSPILLLIIATPVIMIDLSNVNPEAK
jgi:hypothetical protein